MKIPVSIALVIALGAGLVFGSSAHGFAAAPLDELAETAGKFGALLSDDDLQAVMGSDAIEAACYFFGGGVAGRGLVHAIAKRAILGVCGIACAAGVLAITVFCALY